METENEHDLSFSRWQTIRDIADKLHTSKTTIRTLIELAPAELRQEGIKQEKNRQLISKELAECIRDLKGTTTERPQMPLKEKVTPISNPLADEGVKALIKAKDEQIERLEKQVSFLEAQLTTKDKQISELTDTLKASQTTQAMQAQALLPAEVKERKTIFSFFKRDRKDNDTL